MSRIIITGHPASGLEEVEELLILSGMSPALRSRREGMLPTEITSALHKAHHAPSVWAPACESEFRQLEVGPVWHCLILDLLLGNADQELWGWADPQAIFLLDHWRTLDPQTLFLLVYDKPHSLLVKAAQDSKELLEDAVMQQHLLNWQAYNGAMLRFYLRNSERCLLINARQAAFDPGHFLSQLKDRLPISNGFTLPGPVRSGTGHAPKSDLAKSIGQAHALTKEDPADTLRAMYGEETENFMVVQYLEDHPVYLDIYQELDAAADIPGTDDAHAKINKLDAWRALLKQRQTTAGILNRLLGEYQKLVDIHAQESKERERCQNRLARVQDQLESVFEENQRLKSRTDGLRKEREDPGPEIRQAERTEAPKAAPRGAADLVKKHLSYRLGSTMVSRARSVRGWCRMPFDLVMAARAFHREKATAGHANRPPLRSYEDYREAERVMGQLSYRLGNVFVKNCGSPVGWIKLPFLLIHQIRGFHRSRSNR